MANEIMVLVQETNGVDDTATSFSFLFFAILDPVIEVNGVRVIPTPSSGLPQDVIDFGLLSVGELQALDSGDAIFTSSGFFFKNPSLSQNEYLQVIRDNYNASIDAAIKQLRDQYEFYGLSLNA